MTRRLISSGSTFERLVGYSRAVIDGDFVFVSGTTGFDYQTMTVSDDVLEQTHQTFRNITKALADAGSRLEHVVRVNYILVRPADWERVAPVLGEYFGNIRPAATAIIAGLVDPRMLIEIQVTARVPNA